MALGVGTKVKKGIKNTLFRPDKKGSRMANLYTGKRPNSALAVGAIGLGLGGKVAYEGGLGPQSINKSNPSDFFTTMDPGGASVRNATQPPQVAMNPVMMAGGRLPSNAPDLNATGDMVFGMHNGRHG